MTLAIDIQALRFRYAGEQRFELAIPELQIEAGSNVALTGVSGSGKSTLLKLIAGIIKAQAGKLTILDTELVVLGEAERLAFRRQQIGFAFQGDTLLDYLSAEQNVLYPLRFRGNANIDSTDIARARTLADAFGVSGLLNVHPGALSQGESQRIALARALITEPKLVLADEPTANLDASSKRQVLTALLQSMRAQNATLLMVTHDESLLDQFDQVFNMNSLVLQSATA